jgi:hypothetical protein
MSPLRHTVGRRPSRSDTGMRPHTDLRPTVRVTSPSLLTSQLGVADSKADAEPFPGTQPSQKPSDQAEAAPDEQLLQSPKAQGNQSDGSISLPQSSLPQTVKTQSSAAETVPLSIQQPPEVAPTQVVSPASTQIMAGQDGLLSSDAATPKAPDALSAAPERQASNSAIVPLPRARPMVNAVQSDGPRRRNGPLGEGARSPLFSLFGH